LRFATGGILQRLAPPVIGDLNQKWSRTGSELAALRWRDGGTHYIRNLGRGVWWFGHGVHLCLTKMLSGPELI